MSSKDFYEHYCLVIYPQGQWKRAYEEKLLSKVKESFFNAGGHGSCHICCTCPICRSFEEMFDPRVPGDMDKGCKACLHIRELLVTQSGKRECIILFSHSRPVSKETVEALFKEKNVKKVYVLNLKRRKTEPFDRAKMKKLPSNITDIANFVEHLNEENTLLEIRRGEYFS